MTINDLSIDKAKIAIIGLGYVGLPLSVEFAKYFPVVGFDINKERIIQLKKGNDITLEVEQDELLSCEELLFSSESTDIADCNFYIVTVPTPIDANNHPDLTPLVNASTIVGGLLKPGDIVVYESTVYPGCTEEDCVPILEKTSGLIFNSEFFVGYSPERINPGDKNHRVNNIKKITSGSNPMVADYIDNIYSKIVTVGTHKAASIKIAEAAKVIENTQRDVNIALVNELAVLFNKLEIDTLQVLEAAETKWNFLPFRPGLVGGHCIGVDPYYLTHKAQSVGYHPEIILAGRRLNDNMGNHVVSQLVKAMLKKCIQIEGSRVLIMGFSFKENCPDLRNTRIIDVVKELKEYNILVDIYDPYVDKNEARKEYGFDLLNELPSPSKFEGSGGIYDAILIVVAHEKFKKMNPQDIRSLGKDNYVLFDVKYILPPQDSDLRL